MVNTYLEAPEKFVGREAWQAAPMQGKIRPLKLPVNNVFITFTETDQCALAAKDLKSCAEILKEIQEKAHWDYDMPDVPYNFMIGGDGVIYEGRGWRLRPEDIPNEPELNKNGDTLVIAYIGRRNDNIPKYRMKVLLALEDSLFQFGTSRRFIKSGATTKIGPGWDLESKEETDDYDEIDEEEDLPDYDDVPDLDIEKWFAEGGLDQPGKEDKNNDKNDKDDDVDSDKKDEDDGDDHDNKHEDDDDDNDNNDEDDGDDYDNKDEDDDDVVDGDDD